MREPTPGGTVRVALTDEAKQDVRDLAPLDGSKKADKARKQLAAAVVQSAREIEDHPWVGDHLREDGKIEGVGELRKMSLAPDGTMPPPLRLVYLLEPEGEYPVDAEVVAIGKRENMEVYETASRRMKGR